MVGIARTTRRGLLGLVAGLLAAGGTRATLAADIAAATPPAARAAPPASPARQSPPDAPALPEPPGSVDGSTLGRLLRLLPDTPEARRGVVLNDVGRAAGRAGVAPPPPDADEAAVLAYARALFEAGMAPGPFISGLDEHAAMAASRHVSLAFGAGDIGGTALAGEPPRQTELLLGRFDPAATHAALHACADCPPPARESHAGVPFYAWGGDFEQGVARRFKPPAFDALGRGGRIAVLPGLVYRTLWTEGMRAAIEASLGMRPSLADAPDVAAPVAGLDGLGAFSVFATDDVASQAARDHAGLAAVAGTADEALRRATDPALLLRPYVALALGAGSDDGGPYMVVGLLHAAEGAASENAELLPRRIEQVPSLRTKAPWGELFGPVEARAEGRLLLATARRRRGNPQAWLGWWYARDSLLFHGAAGD